MRTVKLYLAWLFLFLCACSQNESAEQTYDRETQQKPILTHEGIDSVLAQFEIVKYYDLDSTYKNYSDPEEKFRKQLAETEYRVVQGNEIYQYVVGKNRICQFLCPDEYFSENADNLSANKKQYWLVDPKLLHMILDFMLILEEEGYDKYGFHVRESHRHPRYNYARGGASLSQHIWGKAVDLNIEDINRDGKIALDDKDICLEILEDLVGKKGGMGLYPGTMTIHIDTRGHKARWNSYTPANQKK